MIGSKNYNHQRKTEGNLYGKDYSGYRGNGQRYVGAHINETVTNAFRVTR